MILKRQLYSTLYIDNLDDQLNSDSAKRIREHLSPRELEQLAKLETNLKTKSKSIINTIILIENGHSKVDHSKQDSHRHHRHGHKITTSSDENH